MIDCLNELIKNKDVCRSALATQGLLTKVFVEHPRLHRVW